MTHDEINWNHVDERATCMARDKDGEAAFYHGDPETDKTFWYGERVGDAGAFASYNRGTCDWKDSLVRRPQ